MSGLHLGRANRRRELRARRHHAAVGWVVAAVAALLLYRLVSTLIEELPKLLKGLQ